MTLLLNRSDVADLLPIEACIEAVEGAFKLHGEGRADPPGILGMRAKKGSFHVKAGFLDLGRRYFAAKTNANFPGNPARFGLSLTPDRFLVVLLVPALAIRRPGRYLLDFLPFAALIILYAECRGLAHVVHPVPHYLPQLRAEKFLFAGQLPTVDLQEWLWSGDPRWFDRAILYVTRIHSIVPMSLAFALWLKRRALFYRFAVTFLTLSFAAALTFWLFPSAPPWAAAEKGLVDVTKIGGSHVATSSVQTGGGTIYRLIHGNPYAAIPSLHGGYAFLIFLFVATLAWRAGRRRLTIGLAALYPALQSFAVLYTGNHYVVDLLIGFAYAGAAFLGVQWCWRRLGLPE